MALRSDHPASGSEEHIMINALKKELLETQRTLGWMDLVIAHIEDSVCAIDEHGTILFANDSFARLTNKHRIYLLGTNFIDAITLTSNSRDLFSILRENPDTYKRLHEFDGLYEMPLPNKGRKYIKLSTNYLATMNQTVILLQDVTGQEELDMMRRKFISLASHQLRTPLSVINVHIQMLRDGYEGPLNKGQAVLVNNVIEGVGQMQELVATLLNTGRIEEGKAALEKQPLHVEGLIKKIAKDLQPRLYKKHIILEIIKPKSVPLISSDAHHLREVLSNLLVNAIQYSKEFSKISLRIDVDRPASMMTLSVIDRGIGIPRESQAQIFSPFYRAENAISHFTNGTGLGLYTVKMLVAELDGDISFKSIEGTGTTFSVKLPL